MSSCDDNIKIELDDIQKDIISSYLDENGKLSCINALSVARKIGLDKTKMSAVTKSMGIKITDCELGVFGDISFLDKDEKLYENLQEKYNGVKKLDCKVYWDEAQSTTLYNIGSTVKNSDLEVINCQLGCFKLKKGKGKENGS